MFVALNMSEYKEKPQIGNVKSVSENTLEIEWYNGSWTTTWKVHKIRKGRELVVWKEEVPKSSVVLFDFSLTPNNKLREATRKELKRVYEDDSDM
jgi:hypothetical protein